ncbi:MAG: Holliday junction branch migration DNA helicase RuvB [Candidatus Jidaibacter sp.]|jgi:Holliday junction DNA helicase RuvB|nr:Holliday junction branch migration DNA helicase RuvB [Candidatus Jidaibacter sp.]
MLAESAKISEKLQEDESGELKVRPRNLSDFIGQGQLKGNLRIFLEAAKSRGEALDHVIFYGPPGLGKTTLSQIMAQELEVNIKITSGPTLSKAGELAAILTNLQPNDVLFIDEIHRLPPAVEEVLYSAMEDFALDLVIGDGPAARSVRINLPKFTLIGATTRLGLLSNPLKDRFGIPLKLDFYKDEELQAIVLRGAKVLGVDVVEDAAAKIAKCSRGTPRIALRLLRRVRDFQHAAGNARIELPIVCSALMSLGIDDKGLDGLDHKYLMYIAQNYNGGPVGIDTISAGVAEDKDTIEDMVEPFLMQMGLVKRTSKGRELSSQAFVYLNIPTDAG